MNNFVVEVWKKFDFVESLKLGLLETATSLYTYMSYVRRINCQVCELIN
jgi:hypothetical protein